MLHMLVNVHNPESCAYRSAEDDAALTPGLERFGAAAEARGASLRGWWVNTGAHTFFLLVDAPNAHVVDELLRDAELTGRTHTQTFAVDDMGDLLARDRADGA